MRLLRSRLQRRGATCSLATQRGNSRNNQLLLGALTSFDERGAATFAHLASEQTIAQLFRQVYYVNKYATNFCMQIGGGISIPGKLRCLAYERSEHAPKREHLSRVDSLVYDAGNQLLEDAAAADATSNEVVQPGA